MGVTRARRTPSMAEEGRARDLREMNTKREEATKRRGEDGELHRDTSKHRSAK